MKTISVKASKDYSVLISTGLLPEMGKHIRSVKGPCKAALISDSHVWPIYGAIAEKSLSDSGFRVFSHVFPAGECSKNGNTYLEILNFLAVNQFTRSDLLIALGGGVTGDLAGFAAATYLRGIACVQIPTTLLAMVDSSVGGKTAIDLPAGKNLAGAFYQPDLVLCDTTCLDTLPEAVFRDGCAEVIKYAVLYDAPLFDHLLEKGLSFRREDVIACCVAHKRDVVCEDEFDTGLRQMLNLGHTIGHSIEALSQYEISHGQAVAMGMAVICRSAWKQGICPEHVYTRIVEILEKFGLPYRTSFSAEDLASSALSDKKRFGALLNLIVPREIGSCRILPTPVEQLISVIEVGL